MSSSNQIGYQWKPTTNKIIQQKKKDFSKINAVDETGISLCIRFAFKNITPNKVTDKTIISTVFNIYFRM